MVRKVWIYSPRLGDMSELKKGDLFQIQKSATACNIGDSTHEVIASRMIHDPNYGEGKNG